MTPIRIAIATSQSDLPAGDKALAAALTRLGFDVHPAIWSRHPPKWDEFDVVVVRSCWDYHLREPEFLGWISCLERDEIVVLNPPNLLRWNLSKLYLAELANSGITIPDTIFPASDQEVDLAEICQSRGWRSAVVKPTVSASAYRTERRCSGLVRGPAMVQQYLEAIESSGEWSLVFLNQEFSHAVIKKPIKGDFRVQVEFGGSVKVAQPSTEILEFAQSVLGHLVLAINLCARGHRG